MGNNYCVPFVINVSKSTIGEKRLQGLSQGKSSLALAQYIIMANVGIISWQCNSIKVQQNGVSGGKMSTMNLGSVLSLGKEARRLSLTESLDLEDEELERLMGMKSASKYEEESKAKEKTVNHLITHAEKVTNFYSGLIPVIQ